MLLTTNAIVLSALKYKDSSLIVSCYTKELGVQSYILHHIFKAKKGKLNPAYFQLLTQLEVQTNYKPNQSLHLFRSGRPSSQRVQKCSINVYC